MVADQQHTEQQAEVHVLKPSCGQFSQFRRCTTSESQLPTSQLSLLAVKTNKPGKLLQRDTQLMYATTL
jgi:hypothetical protein